MNFEKIKEFCDVKNIERFYEWLVTVTDSPIDEAYMFEVLDELDNRYCETNNEVYELSSVYTKSGNPEVYGYSVEEIWDGEDFIKRIYVF